MLSDVPSTPSPSSSWLRKRRLTVIAFSFHYGLLGLEYGIQIANLWIYLNQSVTTNHPKTFYGVIMASYFLSAGIIGLPVTKYADRTRNVRLIFFTCNAAKIIGSFMYILHFSPWYLVVSLVISGCGNAFRAVGTGELARCYNPNEFMAKASIIGISVGVGFMSAPAINAAFTNVNIEIGSLRITFTNICGIYMAVLFAIAEIVTYFMIYDLSKEYDLKYFTERENAPNDMTRKSNGEGKDECSFLLTEKDATLKQVVKELLKHKDSCLLISLSFFEIYMLSNFYMWKSMLIIDTLKWSVTTLYAFLCGTGIVTVIPAIVVMLIKFSNVQLFLCSVFGIIAYAVIQAIFLVLMAYNKNNILNIVLLVIMALLYSSVLMVKAILLIGFLTKMVSSKYLSQAHSVRVLSELFGRLPGVLAAGFQFEWIKIVGPVYIGVLIIFVILFTIRRKSFCNPSVIL